MRVRWVAGGRSTGADQQPHLLLCRSAPMLPRPHAGMLLSSCGLVKAGMWWGASSVLLVAMLRQALIAGVWVGVWLLLTCACVTACYCCVCNTCG